MMFDMYILYALLSLIVLATFFINRFGITSVYSEPGAITMASACFIVSTTPGVVLQFVGFIYTLFIFVTLLVVTSAIFSFSSITVPSSSSTHIFISSSVAGSTFPIMDNMLVLFSIPSAKSLFTLPIAFR